MTQFRIGGRESEISRRGPVRPDRTEAATRSRRLYVCQQTRRKLGLRKPCYSAIRL
jgi:hypothetical protein